MTLQQIRLIVAAAIVCLVAAPFVLNPFSITLLNYIGIYALAELGVLFVLAGLSMLVGVLRCGVPLLFAVIGVVMMSLPAAMFIAGGRTVAPDGRRSEEADKLLAIVADLVGAEELASS